MNTLKNESHKMNNQIIYLENEVNNDDKISALHKKNIHSNEEFGLMSDINSATGTDNTFESSSSDSSDEVVNCLSLTVKKDYSLSIVKHIIIRGFKDVWRIAVSFLTLHFLKFFF